MIKLTVITINLNNADGLAKTLSPLPFIHETKLPIEWIVIDGGSTDDSTKVIHTFKEYLAYFESTQDKGIYDAMNKGLAYAKGEYLIFMNSGDKFIDQVLTSDWMNKLCGDVVYGNYVAESSINPGILVKQSSTLDFFFLLQKTINHQSVFIKNTHFKNKHFDINYKVVADWIFLFELLKKPGITVTYINEPVCCFNLEGFGTINSTTRLNERRKYLNSIYSDWELDSLLNASRMRSKSWFMLLIETLDSRKKEILIYLVLKLINPLGKKQQKNLIFIVASLLNEIPQQLY